MTINAEPVMGAFRQAGGHLDREYLSQDTRGGIAVDDTIHFLAKYRIFRREGMIRDQAVRSILGRLLFGGDEVKKSVKVLSGGETGAVDGEAGAIEPLRGRRRAP